MKKLVVIFTVIFLVMLFAALQVGCRPSAGAPPGTTAASVSAPALLPTQVPTPIPASIPTPSSAPAPAPGLTAAPPLAPAAPTLKSPLNGGQISSPTPPIQAPPLSGAALESLLGVHAANAKGEKKVIVIMADFPDVKPALSKDQILNKVFGDLDNYFRDASYGQMWITGNVTGPYTLPHPIADYNYSVQNLQADRTKLRSLVKDVLNAADGDVNFSRYSYVMLVLGAASRSQFTGGSGCAIPGLLGHSGTEKVVTRSGQTVSSIAMFPEDCFLGDLVHDTIHMLGGVIGESRVTPCLYDQDLESTPGDFRGFVFPMIHMGFWCPLSCHVYKPELPPSGLVAWTKLRLGWIEPSKIAVVNPGQTATVTLGPLDSPASSTLVIKIPLTSNTFYLVENHQKVGFDQYDPSAGVLISYADDGYKDECRHGQAPVQLMDANPDVPYLQGAAFYMGKKEIFEDTQNNLAIILLRKVDLSYEIKITTVDKAGIASGRSVFPTFPAGFQRTK